MKKFIWPLQRLLDIKVKQEDFARIELVTITEQIVIIRGQIMMQKMVLRNLFSELNKTLHQNLEQAEQKRKNKIEEVVALRKLRKSLDQLRAKALIRYREEINQAEQKQLDESITTTFARKILMPV